MVCVLRAERRQAGGVAARIEDAMVVRRRRGSFIFGFTCGESGITGNVYLTWGRFGVERVRLLKFRECDCQKSDYAERAECAKVAQRTYKAAKGWGAGREVKLEVFHPHSATKGYYSKGESVR